MKSTKQLKKEAWETLRGKRKTFGLVWLVYFGIVTACVLLSMIYVGAILQFLLLPPFIMGLKLCFLKLIRNKTVKPGDVVDGIGHMKRVVPLYFINSLLVELWSLLLIVPGVVKGYSYSLSYYVLADNPDMTQSEAREESMRLMEGNKMRLFLLELSFLGWTLLGVLSCGILMFWIQPYIQATGALFYDELRRKKPRYGIPVEEETDQAAV